MSAALRGVQGLQTWTQTRVCVGVCVCVSWNGKANRDGVKKGAASRRLALPLLPSSFYLQCAESLGQGGVGGRRVTVMKRTET